MLSDVFVELEGLLILLEELVELGHFGLIDLSNGAAWLSFDDS